MNALAPGNVADLLAEMDALGIQLAADGQRLRFRPREKMTVDLAARLKAHKAGLLALLQGPKVATPTPKPTPRPTPPAGPTPAMPEAWFRLGAQAPRREQFEYDPETKTHPGWWDYLYEVHNRGLMVIAGKVVRRCNT
jgi:hypothetical protein